MKRWRWLKVSVANILITLVLALTIIPVQSQQVIDFRNHSAVTTFLENIRFSVELCGLPAHAKVYLNLRFSHEYWQSILAFTDEATSNSCAIGRYTYKMEDYPPFISVEYYWQVNPQEGGFYEGPRQATIYEDTRFAWDEMKSENFTIFWHDRSAKLGKQILEIAQEAEQSEDEFFGIALNHPYKIVIFNNDEEFFAWNVNSSDYVGGEAYPAYDLTVQVVQDDSRDWLNEVIPHEISHLYFYQAASHPGSKSYPPYWLDEGVAVFNEFGDHTYEDEILKEAVAGDRIIPLNQLANGFGDDHDRVDLAYAEGYSAVSYLVNVYGRDSLKSLLNSYRRGKPTEEAFNNAIKLPYMEFETNWEDRLKENYSNEAQVVSTEITPIQERPVSSSNNTILSLALCLAGFAPVFCLIAAAGAAIISFLVKQTLKS